jgi:hypothetical protein
MKLHLCIHCDGTFSQYFHSVFLTFYAIVLHS